MSSTYLFLISWNQQCRCRHKVSIFRNGHLYYFPSIHIFSRLSIKIMVQYVNYRSPHYITLRGEASKKNESHPSTKKITIRALDKWLTVNEKRNKKLEKKEMIPYSNFHGVRFFPLSRAFRFVSICNLSVCSFQNNGAFCSSVKVFWQVFYWFIIEHVSFRASI